MMEEVVNELGSPFLTATTAEMEYASRQAQVVIEVACAVNNVVPIYYGAKFED